MLTISIKSFPRVHQNDDTIGVGACDQQTACILAAFRGRSSIPQSRGSIPKPTPKV